MERCQGLARLEWWANASTCLGSFGVRVTTDVAGGQGECGAVFDPPLDPSEREGFGFLMALDPLFTLCFDLERTLHVTVTAVDGERLVLSVGEESPAQRIGPGQAPW